MRFHLSNFLQVRSRKIQLLLAFPDFHLKIDETLPKRKRPELRSPTHTDPNEDVYDNRRCENLGATPSRNVIDIFDNLDALAAFDQRGDRGCLRFK